MVVVSTDEAGAKVVASRILEQIERSDLLRHELRVQRITSRELKLPSQDGQEPVEKLVQEVADSITEMSMAALRRSQASAN